MVTLEVNGLSFRYPALDILNKVSFMVEKGDCIAIMGMNGAGKSTLLKCINRVLKKTCGDVSVEGECIDGISQRELAKKMSYVVQRTSFANMSVFDTVLLGRKPYIVWDTTRSDHEKVRDVLKTMSLDKFALRNVNNLSGGEAQKVSLARAIVQETDIMLLDEPTSNLDMKNQLEVISMIKKIAKEKGIAAVVTMHDINLALRFADKFIFLKDKEIYTVGGEECVTSKTIREVYDVEVKVVVVDNMRIVIPNNIY